MKIVTLSSKDIYGGAAKVAYRLHKYLLGENINNIFLVNNKKSKDNSVTTVTSLHKRRGKISSLLHKYQLINREKNRIKKWKKYIPTREDKVHMDLEVSLLENNLKEFDFDLLQLHWVGESFVNFTEFENISQPVVWTLHDCFAFTGICAYFESCEKFKSHCGNCPQLHSGFEKDLSYEVFEQKLERYKDIDFHIVCPSNWLALETAKSKLLGKYPISVIPNGIDSSFFFPIPKKDAKISLGLDVDKKVILFGGIGINGDTRKGGHLFVETLSHLKQIYPSENQIEFIIIGAINLDYDLGYKTTFLGYVDNEILMRIAYSAADVCVVPSMYENLPTVIMESLACGTPVTAFNIGGNPDMVEHRINGYLATPYDTNDFANGIKFSLENNIDNILSLNARKKVLENFKIEDVGARYIQLYESILKQKSDEGIV